MFGADKFRASTTPTAIGWRSGAGPHRPDAGGGSASDGLVGETGGRSSRPCCLTSPGTWRVWWPKRLRKAVERQQPTTDTPALWPITVSIGVAAATGQVIRPCKALVNRADRALLVAKQNGGTACGAGLGLRLLAGVFDSQLVNAAMTSGLTFSALSRAYHPLRRSWLRRQVIHALHADHIHGAALLARLGGRLSLSALLGGTCVSVSLQE